MKGLASRLLREPLVLFLVFGTGIFALDGLGMRLDPSDDDRRIEVSLHEIERIRGLWTARMGRAPTDGEIRMLIDDHVREEVLYREALRLGLDRDDIIIRRRLAQKMSFLMEDAGAVEEPDEAALLRFFDKHPERYARAATVTFEHVYFSRDQRGDHAVTDARRTVGELRDRDIAEISGQALGDPFLLPRGYAGETLENVASVFGSDFADSLGRLGLKRWHGPLRSAYGIHLVRLSDRQPAAPSDFADVRNRVVEDYRREQRAEMNRRLYENLRRRYDTRIAATHDGGVPGDPERSMP